MIEMASCDVISCGGQWIEAGLGKYTGECLLRAITLIRIGWAREMREVEERRTVGENLLHTCQLHSKKSLPLLYKDAGNKIRSLLCRTSSL